MYRRLFLPSQRERFLAVVSSQEHRLITLLPSFEGQRRPYINNNRTLSSSANRRTNSPPQKDGPGGYGNWGPPPDRSVLGAITVAQPGAKNNAYCIGCGADIVSTATAAAVDTDNDDNNDDDALDFTVSTTTKSKSSYDIKQDIQRKSRIENWSLCSRCLELNEYNEEEEEAATTSSATTAPPLDNTLKDLSPDFRMIDVFRQNVTVIRKLHDAVVLVCADATNTHGTLLTKIRNYVGGNTILLAITRCDVLPSYVWNDTHQMKHMFHARAAEFMQPAAVYLCSDRHTTGLPALVDDIFTKLKGRDLYIVGCANIGKSTLTNVLVQAILERERGAFQRGDKQRWVALHAARSTPSALPGTTLGNIRIPCFANDSQQAVWDTPGLVVDNSLMPLFPRRMQRPVPIEPQIHVVEQEQHRSLALCVCDLDGAVLVRFEVRLKKRDSARREDTDDPLRLVWNSPIQGLQTRVVSLATAAEEEEAFQEKVAQLNVEQEERDRAFQAEKPLILKDLGLEMPVAPTEEELAAMSAVDAAKAKEEYKAIKKDVKRQMGVEYDRRKTEELGGEEAFRHHKAQQTATYFNLLRHRKLTSLVLLHEVIVEPKEGMDIMLAHFGWLGVLLPRTARIRVWTPQTGIKVGHFSPLPLPASWGEYKNSLQVGSSEEPVKDVKKDDEFDMDEWEGPEDVVDDTTVEISSNPFADNEDDPFAISTEKSVNTKEFGDANTVEFAKKFVALNDRDTKGEDPWDVFRGEKVGWMWDTKPRFLKGKMELGWNPIPASWNGKDIRNDYRPDSQREARNEYRSFRNESSNSYRKDPQSKHRQNTQTYDRSNHRQNTQKYERSNDRSERPGKQRSGGTEPTPWWKANA